MASAENGNAPILVRGVGDVGSAVAALLFHTGYIVAIHDDPAPATSRRGMAFTDAVFDGAAVLDGLTARRIDLASEFTAALRAIPEPQRGLAPLTIGLGPNFIAGENVDLAIETDWGDRLGAVITAGPTLPLAGEPRAVGGIARARFIYAPVAGRFETAAEIGGKVTAGDVMATIGTVPRAAPLTGIIRGLTHNGVDVTVGTKIIEVDPRGDPSSAFGLGERPRRIAEGVCCALTNG